MIAKIAYQQPDRCFLSSKQPIGITMQTNPIVVPTNEKYMNLLLQNKSDRLLGGRYQIFAIINAELQETGNPKEMVRHWR